MAQETSVRVFSSRVDAFAEATIMRANGFNATVTEATVAANWSDSTAAPPVVRDAIAPCWVVVGRR